MKDFINNLTEDIIYIHNIEIPIINIKDVVKKLGGEIKHKYIKKEIFKEGICRNKDKFIIFTSNNYTNFEIIYYLGCLFLYMGYKIDKTIWTNYIDNKILEIHNMKQTYLINDFVLAFLMPQNKYRYIANINTVNNKVNIKAIADFFNVSISLAYKRGKYLNFLK